MQIYDQQLNLDKATAEERSPLTPREWDCLRIFAQGYNTCFAEGYTPGDKPNVSWIAIWRTDDQDRNPEIPPIHPDAPDRVAERRRLSPLGSPIEASLQSERENMLIGFETTALYVGGVDIDVYRAVAKKGDELGFDSMWMGHHLVFPKALRELPPEDPTKALSLTDPKTVAEWTRRNAARSAKDGHHRHASNGHKPDPWTIFSHLAALTTRLRFASSVYLLPLVNPFVTARAVTTADIVSNGRIIFGVGVGWNKDEFDIVGECFENRGKRTDEILDFLKKLWTEDTIEHRGQYYSFPEVQFEPKPVQRPHPPIIIGGMTPPALRRAARFDGCWIPISDYAVIKKLLADVRGYREEYGVSSQPFEVTVHAPLPLNREAIKRYEDLGVHRLVTVIGTPPNAGENSADGEPVPFSSSDAVPATAQGLCDNLERIAERALS